MSNQIKNRRIGVVAIIVKNRDRAYGTLSEIFHSFGKIIVGRLGIPYRERNISIIALVVDGSTDEIGAMTGKIGQIEEVNVKTAFTNF